MIPFIVFTVFYQINFLAVPNFYYYDDAGISLHLGKTYTYV